MLLQVMPNPSVVTPANYAHLYNTGYTGAWGWAWFNVSETYSLNTGAAFRRVEEHKCRGTLRTLLSSLPQHLKYPVNRQGSGETNVKQEVNSPNSRDNGVTTGSRTEPTRVFGR